MHNKKLFNEYPRKEGDRYRYVRYPVEKENGKWVAVNVCLPTGYNHLPCPYEHDSEKTCQHACDIDNKIVGYTEEEVIAIIGESMANATRPLLECTMCKTVFAKKTSRQYKCPHCGSSFTQEYSQENKNSTVAENIK